MPAISPELGWTPPDLWHFVPIADPNPPNSVNPLFYCAKYPVTNLQYERFLISENFQNKSLWVDFPRFDEHSQPMNETWGEEAWTWLQNELQHKITILRMVCCSPVTGATRVLE